MGAKYCDILGLIMGVFTLEINDLTSSTMSEYKGMFDGKLGCLPTEYRIKVDEAGHSVVEPCLIEELLRMESMSVTKKDNRAGQVGKQLCYSLKEEWLPERLATPEEFKTGEALRTL